MFASPKTRALPTRKLSLGLLLAARDAGIDTVSGRSFCYPFVWISLAFIFEPLNRRLGRRRVSSNGCSTAIGGRCCSARWCQFLGDVELLVVAEVDLPHTGRGLPAHVFEMPLLGYGGYVRFRAEVSG